MIDNCLEVFIMSSCAFQVSSHLVSCGRQITCITSGAPQALLSLRLRRVIAKPARQFPGKDTSNFRRARVHLCVMKRGKSDEIVYTRCKSIRKGVPNIVLF